MTVNLLMRSALTASVLVAFSSAVVFGLYGGSILALVAVGIAGVLLVSLLVFRQRISRLTQRSRAWRSLSKPTISPRALKWIAVLIIYVLLATTPVLFGQSQPPRLDSFALTFGVWAIIFGFFYIIWWIIDTLVRWRRSLQPTVGAN